MKKIALFSVLLLLVGIGDVRADGANEWCVGSTCFCECWAYWDGNSCVPCPALSNDDKSLLQTKGWSPTKHQPESLWKNDGHGWEWVPRRWDGCNKSVIVSDNIHHCGIYLQMANSETNAMLYYNTETGHYYKNGTEPITWIVRDTAGPVITGEMFYVNDINVGSGEDSNTAGYSYTLSYPDGTTQQCQIDGARSESNPYDESNPNAVCDNPVFKGYVDVKPLTGRYIPYNVLNENNPDYSTLSDVYHQYTGNERWGALPYNCYAHEQTHRRFNDITPNMSVACPAAPSNMKKLNGNVVVDGDVVVNTYSDGSYYGGYNIHGCYLEGGITYEKDSDDNYVIDHNYYGGYAFTPDVEYKDDNGIFYYRNNCNYDAKRNDGGYKPEDYDCIFYSLSYNHDTNPGAKRQYYDREGRTKPEETGRQWRRAP